MTHAQGSDRRSEHKRKGGPARTGPPLLSLHYASLGRNQPCRPPNTQIRSMIGKGIPMSQSNKPRPMKSSCVASLRLVTNCQINSPAGEKFRGLSRFRPRGWLHRVGAGCIAAERRYIALASRVRRGGRVAEGARLESVYTGNRIVGSNPTPSAKHPKTGDPYAVPS
jgi:hypothetical protein